MNITVASSAEFEVGLDQLLQYVGKFQVKQFKSLVTFVCHSVRISGGVLCHLRHFEAKRELQALA